MGQGYMHDSDGATEAGRLAYDAILQLQSMGVSDIEIILGFTAELHSLSGDCVSREAEAKSRHDPFAHDAT